MHMKNHLSISAGLMLVLSIAWLSALAMPALSPMPTEVKTTYDDGHEMHLKLCGRELCVASVRIKNRWIYSPKQKISLIKDANIAAAQFYVDASTGDITSVYIVLPIAEIDVPQAHKKCPVARIVFDSKRFLEIAREFQPPCR